jgi:hypothetical protein
VRGRGEERATQAPRHRSGPDHGRGGNVVSTGHRPYGPIQHSRCEAALQIMWRRDGDGLGGRVCGFEHAAQPPKRVVNPGAQGTGRNAQLGRCRCGRLRMRCRWPNRTPAGVARGHQLTTARRAALGEAYAWALSNSNQLHYAAAATAAELWQQDGGIAPNRGPPRLRHLAEARRTNQTRCRGAGRGTAEQALPHGVI